LARRERVRCSFQERARDLTYPGKDMSARHSLAATNIHPVIVFLATIIAFTLRTVASAACAAAAQWTLTGRTRKSPLRFLQTAR